MMCEAYYQASCHGNQSCPHQDSHLLPSPNPCPTILILHPEFIRSSACSFWLMTDRLCTSCFLVWISLKNISSSLKIFLKKATACCHLLSLSPLLTYSPGSKYILIQLLFVATFSHPPKQVFLLAHQ